MEDSLTVDVAGSYTGLRQQLCTHKVTQRSDPLPFGPGAGLTPTPVVSVCLSALPERALHRPPDPPLGHRRGSSAAAERRGGGQVRPGPADPHDPVKGGRNNSCGLLSNRLLFCHYPEVTSS